MKSFSQFIIEKKSDDIVPLKPDEAAKEKSLLRNKGKKGTLANQSGSTKGIDPKEVNKRLSASTTKGDQARSQYNTSGIQGDSNTGGNTPSRDLSNTPSKNPTSAIKDSNKVNPNTRPPTFAEVEASATQTPQGQKAQADAIKGGANNTPSTANKRNGVLDKITKGAEKGRQRSIDGFKNLLDKVKDKGNRVPDQNKGELGKLYKSNSADDSNRAGSVRTNDKINQELTAKRQARIDPNTGKATKKGVENFAINQQTRGLSNKGDAGKKSLETAKKIASNSSGKAYKEIETKINNSDYAGKRANLASADELKNIKADIKNSNTINQKGGKLNIASPDKSQLKNKGIEYKKPDTEILPKTKDGTLKGFETKRGGKVTVNTRPNLNPDQVSRMYQPDGGYGDSNTGYQGSGSTTKNKTFKDFTDKIDDVSKGTKTNLLGKIKKARFYPYAKGASKVGMRGLGVVGAGLQYKSNYDAAKGSKFRKIAKSAIQTASSVAGFTGGAALGTGLGSVTGPGAFVTGTVSGLAASDLTHKASGKIFNKIWKPPTVKKNKKVVTPLAGAGKQDTPKRVQYKGVSIGPS
tara:strand:+ start:562 stop:2298 length:1737 start_codon:yes stop_codon:yes gene_type:complete